MQASLCLFRSTGRSTCSWQRAEFDRWTVDRPVDRQFIFGSFCCQRLYFSGVYKYPICESFSLRFLVRIFPTLLCFHSNQKKFLRLNWTIYLVFLLGFGKSKRRVFGKKSFDSTSSSWFLVFPKDFLWVFDFQSFGFLHTWATCTFLFYRIFVWEKEIVCGFCFDHQVVNPLFALCLALIVLRRLCIWVVSLKLWGDPCVSFVLIPQVVRWLFVGLELCLKEEIVLVRRGVGYSL